MNIKIDYGLSDWEILQQQEGKCDIWVGGTYIIPECMSAYEDTVIAVRIVNEDTDEPICDWLYAKMNDGNWECLLQNIPAGGLYRLETRLWCNRDNSWIENAPVGEFIHHFGVGDVFLIAGQSNAAGYGRGVVTDSAELGVHVLRSLKKWDLATGILHDINSLHSPFLAFAKRMKRALNYPIGLIPTAVGASSLEKWNKRENGELYNEMISVTKKFNIKPKGVLWYQGTQEAWYEADNYLKRFEEIVNDMRIDFNDENLCVFTCQLNCFKDEVKDERRNDWYDEVREAQRRAVHTLKNVYVIPTIDCQKLSDGVHNSKLSNILIGERMAAQALKKLYNIGIDFDAPDIRSIEFLSEDSLVLHFDNVKTDLMAFHVSPDNLPVKIKDDNGIAEIVNYRCHRGDIDIKVNRKILGDVYVSCQCGTNPAYYIHDMGTQMPVLCFNKFKV